MTENVDMRPVAVDIGAGAAGIPAQRRSEYVALALMYFAQGLPAGLAFNALGILIRQGGHSVADVGWTGLAFLPWALKFLWASAIDNACARWGHARLIGATQLMAVALCLGLMSFPPSGALHLALLGIVLLNTVCATQDIATNAYAVARLQGSTAGPANAIQVAAFIAGMLAGGGGLLLVHALAGWSTAMGLMAGMMLSIHLALRLGRRWQAPSAGVKAPNDKVHLRDLRRHPDLAWALAIALLFKFASTAAATLVQPWLIDRGLDLTQAGGLQMTMLVATAAGGVLIGVPLVRRLGNRRAVLVSGVVAAALLGTAWALDAADARDLRLLALTFGVQALFEGALYVAIWALFMNWASPARPGTDYTAMQCGESLSNALAAGVIGGLGQQLGYAHAFALAWLAGAAAIVLIAACLPRLVLQREARG